MSPEYTHHNVRKVLQRVSAFRLLFLLTSLYIGYSGKIKAQSDSASILLPEIEIRMQGRTHFHSDQEGKISLSAHDALKLSHTLGESDMIGLVRTLPGVDRGGGDYASGLSIDGSDPSHTQYILDGAPVIFPYRFGGVFSTFNTPHFSEVKFSRRSRYGLSPRLGGALEFQSATDVADHIGGYINIGLISSSATIHTGVKEKISFIVSGRISYLNKVYGTWLNKDDSNLNYSFGDLNATFEWKPTLSDNLRLSFFHNADCLGLQDSNYGLDTRLKWYNTVSSFRWNHNGRIKVESSLFCSNFSNQLSLSIPQLNLIVPTSRLNIGIYTDFTLPADSNPYNLCWGARCEIDRIIPQWARIEMGEYQSSIDIRQSQRILQFVSTTQLYGAGELCIIPSNFRLKGSLAAGLYSSHSDISRNYIRPFIVPSLQGIWVNQVGEQSLSVAYRQQPIHSVGLSEIGLASDFFIGSGHLFPIQNSLEGIFEWKSPRLPQGMYVKLNMLYSLVNNQAEYTGQLLELIENDYNPYSHIDVADGFNIGFSLSLTKDFGKVTGSLSYDRHDGRRHFKDSRQWWRSQYSSGNTLKAFATWHISDHWLISGDFILRSGRPYTPVKALYVIAGNIAMEYGNRNSARLPLTHSLNLSATYSFVKSFTKCKLHHSVNLSLINILGHKNVEMQYFILNSSDGSYYLKRMYSLYRFLPSISYALQF